MSSRLRPDESGFALIETLVSALLVGIIAVGAFAAIDGASAASGRQRDASQAGALAQQDIERMRALRISDLEALADTGPTTTTQTLQGLDYDVSSEVTSVTDTGAAGGTCVGASSSTSYLQVRSTVVAANQASGVDPVTKNSLVPVPADGGDAVVQITDSTSTPVSGVTVTLTGHGSVLTLAAGCAEWDYLPPGTYTITISKLGYSTPDGTNAQDVSISDGATSTVHFDFDKSNAASIGFWARLGTTNYNAATAGAPAGMDQITLDHSSLPAPRQAPATAGNFQPSISTGSVFPYPTAYTVHPGACSTMDGSAQATSQGSYTLLATTTTAVLSTPSQAKIGGTTDPYPGKIRLPAWDMVATYKWPSGTWGKAGSRTQSGAEIHVYRTADASCGSKVMGVQKTNLSGKTPFPGLPFGRYTLCLQWTEPAGGKNPGTWRYMSAPSVLSLTSYGTTPNLSTLPVDSTNSANKQSCPATYP